MVFVNFGIANFSKMSYNKLKICWDFINLILENNNMNVTKSEMKQLNIISIGQCQVDCHVSNMHFFKLVIG